MGHKEIWIPGLILSLIAVYVTYIVMDHSKVEWFVALLSFAYPFFALFFIEGVMNFASNVTNALTHSPVLSLLFGVGVLAEALILINERNKLSGKDLKAIGLFILVVGLGVSWMPLLNMGTPAAQVLFEDNPDFYIIGFLVFGSVIFFPIYFRDKILTTVNESLVLLWTLLLWYVYLELAPFDIAVAAPLGIASAGVLYINFTKRQISKLAGILMYLWYLVCVVAVSSLMFLASNNFNNGLTPYLAFSLGMMTVFFAVHAMQVLHFHPYFNMDRDQDLKESLRKHATALYSKYEHRDHPPYRTLGLIAIFVVAAYLNSVSDSLPLLFIVLSMMTFAPYLFDRDRWWDWKLPTIKN